MNKEMTNISKADITREVSKVIHPEINFSLVKLGMIKDISIAKSDVSITLLLPFLKIPIKEQLISLVKEAVLNLDRNVTIDIKIAEMNEHEKEMFMKLAKEGRVV